MIRICLVTTGQPSTNPRLVKEADALAAEGYYELTLRFGGNVHRVHLPVATTVVIHKEPEEAVDAVEIER